MHYPHSLHRPTLAAAALVALGLLGGCESTPKIIDNPMNGDIVELAVGQPFTVKLTDMDGPKASWSVEASPSAALTAPAHKEVPAANGALDLDVYDFVASAKGEQDLKFAYNHPGQPLGPDDTISIKVKVS